MLAAVGRGSCLLVRNCFLSPETFSACLAALNLVMLNFDFSESASAVLRRLLRAHRLPRIFGVVPQDLSFPPHWHRWPDFQFLSKHSYLVANSSLQSPTSSCSR